MKSSAHKALASLQHKYQRKICQLGLAIRNELELEEKIKQLESDKRILKGIAFGKIAEGDEAVVGHAVAQLHPGRALTNVEVDFALAESRVSAGTTTGRASNVETEQRLTIERLEFDLRALRSRTPINTRLANLEQDLAYERAINVKAQNKAEASRIEASKWENWACAYATWAVVASAALGVVGYKYAVLTGLL